MKRVASPSTSTHLTRIHLIGIGGRVLGGLAELLHSWGVHVSGSEPYPNDITARLSRQGIACTIGAHAAHLSPHSDCVIVSPRVPKSHPEVARARQWGIPVLTIAQVLGYLTQRKKTLAVAGCHGKTTVGAYLGTVLTHAGLDPSVLLRTPVEVWNSNVRCGKGEYLVLEADENERRFLSLEPVVGIIMNIEVDHLEYFEDLDAIVRAYHQFARTVCAKGVLIANRDDERVQRACKGVRGTVVWFGKEEGAEVRALNIRTEGGTTSFLLHIKRGEDDVQFDLAVPGQHQISNALAVAAVCHWLRLPLAFAREAFASYHGGTRHMDSLGNQGETIVIDDAADHPSEIKTVLRAVRARFPAHALWCVFQPYRAHRTQYLMEEYAKSFTDADAVFVLPVVSGVEEGVQKNESARLVQCMGQYHTRVQALTYAEALGYVRVHMPARAVLLTLGADPVRAVGTGFLQPVRPLRQKMA